jgi:hypothetical protein
MPPAYRALFILSSPVVACGRRSGRRVVRRAPRPTSTDLPTPAAQVPPKSGVRQRRRAKAQSENSAVFVKIDYDCASAMTQNVMGHFHVKRLSQRTWRLSQPFFLLFGLFNIRMIWSFYRSSEFFYCVLYG